MTVKEKNIAGWREFGKCAIALCLSVVIAMGVLLAGCFASQDRIKANLLESTDGLRLDGQYPVIGDRKINSLLDNATDISILRATAGMNRNYLGSILTNPLYSYNVELKEGEDYAEKCLELYCALE